MPVNSALLQLVGVTLPDSVKNEHRPKNPEEARHYVQARDCIEHFAIYLVPMISGDFLAFSYNILEKLHFENRSFCHFLHEFYVLLEN